MDPGQQICIRYPTKTAVNVLLFGNRLVATGGPMTCASTEPDYMDALFRLLADSCRRTLLEVLFSGPPEKPLGDVVDQVVAESTTGGTGFLNDERVTTELHHKHLPAIGEHGFVDYDRERNTVTYRRSEKLESLLEVLDELDGDAQQ